MSFGRSLLAIGDRLLLRCTMLEAAFHEVGRWRRLEPRIWTECETHERVDMESRRFRRLVCMGGGFILLVEVVFPSRGWACLVTNNLTSRCFRQHVWGYYSVEDAHGPRGGRHWRVEDSVDWSAWTRFHFVGRGSLSLSGVSLFRDEQSYSSMHSTTRLRLLFRGGRSWTSKWSTWTVEDSVDWSAWRRFHFVGRGRLSLSGVSFPRDEQSYSSMHSTTRLRLLFHGGHYCGAFCSESNANFGIEGVDMESRRFRRLVCMEEVSFCWSRKALPFGGEFSSWRTILLLDAFDNTSEATIPWRILGVEEVDMERGNYCDFGLHWSVGSLFVYRWSYESILFDNISSHEINVGENRCRCHCSVEDTRCEEVDMGGDSSRDFGRHWSVGSLFVCRWSYESIILDNISSHEINAGGNHVSGHHSVEDTRTNICCRVWEGNVHCWRGTRMDTTEETHGLSTCAATKGLEGTIQGAPLTLLRQRDLNEQFKEPRWRFCDIGTWTNNSRSPVDAMHDGSRGNSTCSVTKGLEWTIQGAPLTQLTIEPEGLRRAHSRSPVDVMCIVTAGTRFISRRPIGYDVCRKFEEVDMESRRFRRLVCMEEVSFCWSRKSFPLGGEALSWRTILLFGAFGNTSEATIPWRTNSYFPAFVFPFSWGRQLVTSTFLGTWSCDFKVLQTKEQPTTV